MYVSLPQESVQVGMYSKDAATRTERHDVRWLDTLVVPFLSKLATVAVDVFT